MARIRNCKEEVWEALRGGVLAGMMEGVEQLLGRSCASWGLTLYAQAVEWSQSGE